jgi:hypothetical protein
MKVEQIISNENYKISTLSDSSRRFPLLADAAPRNAFEIIFN